MEDDIASVSQADLDSYSKENNLSPEDEVNFKKEFFSKGIKEIDKKFPDSPDNKIKAYRAFESMMQDSLLVARNRHLQDTALQFADGDRERANDLIIRARTSKAAEANFKPEMVQDDNGLMTLSKYEKDPTNPALGALSEILDDRSFHLNEITGKPDYIYDKKGNPAAVITTRKTSDTGRSSFFSFLKNDEMGIKGLPTQQVDYSVPTDEELAKHISDLDAKIKENYPEGGYGTTPYAKSIADAFDKNPSKKAQAVRDDIAEVKFLRKASPDQAKEYLAGKQRNNGILESPYVRENVTNVSVGSVAEDTFKGFLGYEAGVVNSGIIGPIFGEEAAQGSQHENFDVLSKDTSMGSELTGLKDSGVDKLLTGVSSGMNSLGAMIIPLSASLVTGGQAATLGGMGAMSFGSKLDQIDTKIDEVNSKLDSHTTTAAEKDLLLKDLNNLKTNRILNAVSEAVIQTATESIGGPVGGVFFKPFGKTIGAKLVTGVAEENLENFIAEPLSYALDQATLGDRLTSDMQDPLSILYATTTATLPLMAASGIVNKIFNKEEDPSVQRARDIAAAYDPVLMDSNIAFISPAVPTGQNQFKANAEPDPNSPSKGQYQFKANAEPDPNSPSKGQNQSNANAEPNPNSPNKETNVEITPEVVETAKKNADTMSETLKEYEGTKEEEDKEVQKVKDDAIHLNENPKTASDPVNIKNTEGKNSQTEGQETPPVPVSRDVLEHAHSIFESSPNEEEFTKGMIAKFGDSVKDFVKSIWNHILEAYRSTYKSVSDSIGKAQARREFAKATNINTSTPERLMEIAKKYPSIYNIALRTVMAQYDAHGLNGISVSDLAKMYSFQEKGFGGPVTIVDEGQHTADLQGKSETEGVFVNPDGSSNNNSVLSANEQHILKTLYNTNVISEDQLDSASRGLFRRRKFLSIYARKAGVNVETLANPSDSTVDSKRQQSKVAEARSLGATLDPKSNDTPIENRFMARTYEHGTESKNDVFTHLGLKVNKLSADDPNNPSGQDAFSLSKPDLEKLYSFYDLKFGENNWVVKDSDGAAGSGFSSAQALRADLKSPNYTGINFSGIAQEKLDIRSEYRVHVYVDSKGKARAVPFATNGKVLYDEGTASHAAPYRMSNRFTLAMERFAEDAIAESLKTRTDKSTGLKTVYGVDVALLNNENGKEPSIRNSKFRAIEFNSTDPHFDESNPGGASGSFGLHQGFPLAHLQSFLRGNIPPDIALSNVLSSMLLNGNLKVDGQSLVPTHVSELKSRTENSNRRSRLNSGIDPTNIVADIKTLIEGAKTFIQFSKEAIKKFGDSIKIHLNELWKNRDSVDASAKTAAITMLKNEKSNLPAKVSVNQAAIDMAKKSPIYLVHKERIDTRYVSAKSANAIAQIKEGNIPKGDMITVLKKIKQEERKNKYKEIKRQTPEAFEGLTPDLNDPNIMVDATKQLIKYLDSIESDPIEHKAPRKLTKERVEAQNHLNENLALYHAHYVNSDEFISLPTNLKLLISSGIEGISGIDEQTSTNNLKRAAASLASLIDTGNPVGFFKYAQAEFTADWIAKANMLGEKGEFLSDRLSAFRRGFISPELGSAIHIPAELDKMSAGRNDSFRFLSDLMNVMLGSLNEQQVERDLEMNNFSNFAASQYPKRVLVSLVNEETNSMPIRSRVTAGIASQLIQYKANSQVPMVDLTKAFNLMSLGIAYREQVKDQSNEAKIDREAFTYLTSGIDYDNMSHDDVINIITSRLSNQERNVMDYLIRRSSSFLPSLRAVSSMVANRPLEEWVNYTHSSVKTEGSDFKEDRERGGVASFNSMEPPLQLRKGLGTETDSTGASRAKGYYETDILKLGGDFFDSATYEKHTGIERMLLKGLMTNPNFTDRLEKTGTEKLHPRSEALKEMMGNIHFVRSDAHFLSVNQFASAFLELMGLGKGIAIVSLGSMAGNFGSSALSMTGLLGLEGESGKILPVVTYERLTNRTIANGLTDILKKNFPSQLSKLKLFDDSNVAHVVSDKSIKGFETALAARRGVLNTLFSRGLGVAYSVPLKAIKKIVRIASHFTGSAAEGHTATNMWWAIYIDKVNSEHGKDFHHAEDFLTDPVIDQSIATYATMQVDKITGNTSSRELQGSMHHLDTTAKVLVTNSVMIFTRQINNIRAQFVTELQHSYNAENRSDRAKHIGRATTLIASALAYTYVKGLVSVLFHKGATSVATLMGLIAGGDDDEDRKKAIRLEIEKQLERKKRRVNFGAAFDAIGATVGTPFAQSTIAKALSEYAYDKFVTNPDDIEKEAKIKGMTEELARVTNTIKAIDLTGSVKNNGKLVSYDDLMNKANALNVSIDETRNTKGINIASDGKRSISEVIGSFGIVSDAGYSLIDAFSEAGAKKEAIAQRAEELNNFPGWAKLIDIMAKTGVTGFADNVTKRMAQQQLEAQQAKETEINKATLRSKTKLGL